MLCSTFSSNDAQTPAFGNSLNEINKIFYSNVFFSLNPNMNKNYISLTITVLSIDPLEEWFLPRILLNWNRYNNNSGHLTHKTSFAFSNVLFGKHLKVKYNIVYISLASNILFVILYSQISFETPTQKKFGVSYYNFETIAIIR